MTGFPERSHSALDAEGHAHGHRHERGHLLPVWKVVVSDDDYAQEDTDSTELEAMTDDQRDEFLRVKA
jgi:hypothetical protein